MNRFALPRRALLAACIALALVFTAGGPARAIEKIDPDPAAVQLVNKLLAALSIEDESARLQAVLPLVHKSLRTSAGTDLAPMVKRYSYKKASQNVQFYQQPVQIYEVHKGRVSTVGFRDTAERGRRDKYFVMKKPGVPGRPAPISVFIPESGASPSIIDMGSL